MKTQVKVGLLGCGVVGSGVARILTENSATVRTRAGAHVQLWRIAELDIRKAAQLGLPESLFTTNAISVATDPEIDIVVECIGGAGEAKELVLAAIKAGKSIVTPNKELIAREGAEILRLADERGVDIRFEGSVGGGIPIIRPLKEHFAGDHIVKIAGILNGTTNYILTRMSEEGAPFEAALAEAQQRGYAEPDPTNDINGNDAAYKLAILASIAFGQSVPVDRVSREGIERMHPRDIEAAEELGYVVKLLAIGKAIEDGQLELRVHPTMIPKSHPLAAVRGVANAVFITGRYVGDVMLYGPGAGALPTGSALVGDVIEIARNLKRGATGRVPCVCSGMADVMSSDEVHCGHYMRVSVPDRPGVLGAMATVLGDHQVSVASVYQKYVEGTTAEIVWITHKGREKDFRDALATIECLPVVERVCNTIRVEAE